MSLFWMETALRLSNKVRKYLFNINAEYQHLRSSECYKTNKWNCAVVGSPVLKTLEKWQWRYLVYSCNAIKLSPVVGLPYLWIFYPSARVKTLVRVILPPFNRPKIASIEKTDRNIKKSDSIYSELHLTKDRVLCLVSDSVFIWSWHANVLLLHLSNPSHGIHSSDPLFFLLFSRSQKVRTVILKMDHVVGLVRKTGR